MAGFWGSANNKELKLEDVMENVNKIGSIGKESNHDVISLMDETLMLIQQLSPMELSRDFLLLSDVITRFAEYIGRNAEMDRGLAIVELIDKLSEKIVNNPHIADAQRLARQAIFSIYISAEDWKKGSEIIAKELQILRQEKNTLINLEESRLCFIMATLAGMQNDNVHTEEYLRDSVKTFSGINVDNITPEIEDFWPLYEQFKTVIKGNIPPYKVIEKYARDEAKSQQSQMLP